VLLSYLLLLLEIWEEDGAGGRGDVDDDNGC